MENIKNTLLLILSVFIVISCSSSTESPTAQLANYNFPADNSGLTLPDGFSAMQVADSLGEARHMAVAENGDIYVSLRRQANGGGIVALRDTDGDGVADRKEYFGSHSGTGIGIYNGYLYASSTTEVFRYPMPEDSLVPSGEPEIIAQGFPEQNSHASKSFTFDNSGNIYVNVGAPSNSCQEEDRAEQSPGQQPCPLLERHAGIWQFSASETGQTQQEDGVRYATGLRNVVGLEWNDDQNVLYVTQHGRDQLHANWPTHYSQEESAELPAEALYVVNEGDDFGWPYSYYDQRKDSLMLAPEYGGDGEKTLKGTQYEDQFELPATAFPGHWAPNGLTFYNGQQFPERFHNGAFIAWHGSWNRAPLPQEGYKVTFVPFTGDSASSDFEDFATGFAGDETPQPGSADHRPTGVTVGPNGSLYVSDDSQGTIWRISYTGSDN